MTLSEISRARRDAKVKVKGGDCPVVACMVLSGKSYAASETICRRWGYRGNGLSRVETLCAIEDATGRRLAGKMKVLKDLSGLPVAEAAAKVGFGVIFSTGHVMPVTGGQASNVEPGAVTAWAIKF